VTGIYYDDIDETLRAAGLTVRECEYNAGWQTRARSSGGFPSPPLAVFWHHTASSTSIENDLAWQCHGCDDAPVGNMTIDREGSVWIVAAGASNCAGKGGPATFSRGTIPADSGNTRGWNVECACDGVGGAYSAATVEAYFLASNALNARFGNLPTDVISHALGAGDGWTDRKIDPATADAVEGPWQPGAVNSSGTWSLADLRAECERRSSSSPIPPPNGDDDMPCQLIKGGDNPTVYAWNGVTLGALPPGWDEAGIRFGLISGAPVEVYAQSDIDALLAQQAPR